MQSRILGVFNRLKIVTNLIHINLDTYIVSLPHVVITSASEKQNENILLAQPCGFCVYTTLTLF